MRQRPLLTVDEVITPQVGNCTVFARYVEAGFATQVILNARLTRFYERQDWKTHLKTSDPTEALLLERGLSLSLEPQQDVQSDEAMRVNHRGVSHIILQSTIFRWSLI